MIPRAKNFTDQTGRFLVASISGHSYTLVLYDYDSNYIHADPTPISDSKYILSTYQKYIAILIKYGLKTKLQQLDNKWSQILQQFLEKREI